MLLKLCDSEALQVPARGRLHSVCSAHTTIRLDVWYPKRSCPDGVCEEYPVGRCGIISVFLFSTRLPEDGSPVPKHVGI